MQSKNNWKAWLYLAPMVILMSVFTFYPLINTIVVSFLKNYNYMTQTSDGFTLDNYAYILKIKPILDLEGTEFDVYEENFIRYALPNTLIITFITVPISIILALAIAIALNQIKVLKNFFQTLFFIPYVTNAIAIGMVFSVIFSSDNGVFNFLFGIPEPKYWISGTADRASGMFALCVYIIWKNLPYKILIFLSGLQNIDKQYYEAARIDATPKWKTTTQITIPLLSPQIFYIMITSFIGAFKEYDSVIGLFNGPQTSKAEPYNMYTIVYYIYDSISQDHVQYGAAAAVILFLIILLFTLIELKVSKKKVHY